MPHILRFHDTDEGTTLPNPSQVGHAAAWAGERGYWDVATCLMELAHALADLETPTPPQPCSCPDGQCAGVGARVGCLSDALNREADALVARVAPDLATPPDDLGWHTRQSQYALKLLAAPATPLGAHLCEHGYWTAHNRHVATSGVCDLSAGTGV